MSVQYPIELTTIASANFNSSTNGSLGNDEFGFYLLHILNKYYVIVIIVFGLIGNSISAVVFSGNQLRSRSSSYYLAALAITDAVFLFTLLLPYLENDFVGVKIYNNSVFSCKFFNYLSFVSTFLSVWLIVSFTIERFIAVQYPLQRPLMCTVERAKLIVIGLVICALVINVYILPAAGLNTVFNNMTNQNETVCGILDDYGDTMRIMAILDMVLACIIPVFLIVIMNTMIAVQLYKFSRTYQPPIHFYHEQLRLTNRDESEQNPSTSSLLQPCALAGNDNNYNAAGRERGVIIIHYIKQGNSTSQREDCSGYHTHSRSSSRSRVVSQRLQFNITKMLLVISTAFIVLNLPSYVVRIITMHQEDQNIVDRDLLLAQQYVMLLFYTHFSINFLLYSIYGNAFRRALISYVTDKCRCRCLGQTQHVTFMYKCIQVIQRGRT